MLAACVCLAASVLHAADLTLPATVEGEVGAFISVPSETEGTVVQWVVIDPGINLFPSTLLKDTKTAVVTSPRKGRYRLLAYTAIEGVPSEPAITTVVVGGAEPDDGDDEEDTDPDDEDEDDDEEDDQTPDDKAPFPADGLHVLIVYESTKMNGLTAEQRAIIAGADIRGALNAAAPGKYRIYDQDADLQFVEQVWKDAMAVPRQSVPWLVISNGKAGYNGPLDMSAAKFREMLSEFK